MWLLNGWNGSIRNILNPQFKLAHLSTILKKSQMSKSKTRSILIFFFWIEGKSAKKDFAFPGQKVYQAYNKYILKKFWKRINRLRSDSFLCKGTFHHIHTTLSVKKNLLKSIPVPPNHRNSVPMTFFSYTEKFPDLSFRRLKKHAKQCKGQARDHTG